MIFIILVNLFFGVLVNHASAKGDSPFYICTPNGIQLLSEDGDTNIPLKKSLVECSECIFQKLVSTAVENYTPVISDVFYYSLIPWDDDYSVPYSYFYFSSLDPIRGPPVFI